MAQQLRPWPQLDWKEIPYIAQEWFSQLRRQIVFGITGTPTNNNADVGVIGEVVSSTVVTGSAVALTTATSANVTSISLTAGDWDVYGHTCFLPAGTTNVVYLQSSINTTSATQAAFDASGQAAFTAAGSVLGNDYSITTAMQRISISTTTTVYLVARADFSVSTCKGYGRILARRRR